jgi:RimJ/RimL family protein N-acetyltransferase
MRQILETDRLYLRELTLEDVKRLHEILSDPITMQFWPKPFDLEGATRWVERSIQAYRDLGFGRYGVILKSSGNLIGDCGFMRTEVNGREENDLGYILDKKYWNQGLATEAAKACLRYGLDHLKMNRIVASMETKHLASKAVAGRIGLRVEQEFINPRNRNLPTFLLSIEVGQ